MESFLKLPRAVHFILSLLAIIAGSIKTGPAVPLLFAHCAFVVYWFIYPYAVVSTLTLRVSKRTELNITLFTINWAIAFTSCIFLMLAVFVYEQNEFQLHGLLALFLFYIIYAFVFSFLFPAKIIKTIEMGVEVRYGESLGTFLLLVLMPINILFVHPRVIEALKRPIVR